LVEAGPYENARKCWAKAWSTDGDFGDADWLVKWYLFSIKSGMPHSFGNDLATRYERAVKTLDSGSVEKYGRASNVTLRSV
jgi:hypothetical protein